MLGIWHEGDWLKERFGSANIWLGVSWKSQTRFDFVFINKSSFTWYFMSKCTSSYVAFMANVSLLFLLFMCWL